MKFCSQCGQPTQEGQKFCSKCGYKLVSVQDNQNLNTNNFNNYQQEEPKVSGGELLNTDGLQNEEIKEVPAAAVREDVPQKEEIIEKEPGHGNEEYVVNEEVPKEEAKEEPQQEPQQIPQQVPSAGQTNSTGSSFTFNEAVPETKNFTAQPQSNFNNYNNYNNMAGNNVPNNNMPYNNMAGNNIGNTQTMPNLNQYNYQQSPVGYNGPMTQVKAVKAPRKKMGTAAKIIIAFIILLLLGSAGFYGYGSYVTSKQYVANKIEKAITEKDTNKLLEYMKFSDGGLTIDESNVKAVLNLINSSASYKTNLIENLKEGKSFECFSMVDNGKKLLLFKNYVMEVEPQFINVSANYENVDVKLDGKSVGKTLKDGKIKKFGPFAPGIYKLELVMTNEFGTSTVKETAELKDGEFSYYGDFQLKTAYAYFDIDKMKVSVDGKALERELTRDNNEIGPFPADSAAKLAFFKQYPWGKLQSREYTLDEMYNNGYITEFDMRNSEFRTSVLPTLKPFIESYYVAKSTLDAEKFVNASENCKNEFKNSLFFATQANYSLVKAYLNVDEVYVRTDSSGRDIFEIYVAADYKYEGYDYKGSFTLDMYFDDAQGKWVVDNFSTYGSTDGELVELQ